MYSVAILFIMFRGIKTTTAVYMSPSGFHSYTAVAMMAEDCRFGFSHLFKSKHDYLYYI